MDPQLLKGHLDLVLLSILARTPLHGYALVQALRECTDGALDLPEGTIYPALHRLERVGFLTSTWSEESGRRRKVYALSTSGREELRARRAGWRHFVRTVESAAGA